MTKLHSLRLGIITSAILAVSSSHANAVSYKFSDLGTLGGATGYASAINNVGQIAGSSYTGNGAEQATLWNGTTATNLGSLVPYSIGYAINNAGQVAGLTYGVNDGVYALHATLLNGTTVTDLGTLGGTSSFARGINNAGHVAGYSDTAGDVATHATRWDGNTATDLGTLGGTTSFAYAINNAGQVAGLAYAAGDAGRHATRWDGNTATDLGTLGGTYSGAFAINNAGQVAGYAYISGNTAQHATLWNGTTATDLGTLGGLWGVATTINNVGQVAGWATTVDNVAVHATLWDGTTATDLNSFLTASEINAGWVLQEATGINDSGSIVGNARNTQMDADRAFLLTAVPSVTTVPEPETYALVLVGLGAIGFVTHRPKSRSKAT